MGKRFWIVVFALFIVAAAFVLLGWLRAPASADAAKMLSTFTVRTDDLVITVTESGSIKAQESTDIMCQVGGAASKSPVSSLKVRSLRRKTSKTEEYSVN